MAILVLNLLLHPSIRIHVDQHFWPKKSVPLSGTFFYKNWLNKTNEKNDDLMKANTHIEDNILPTVQ